MFQHLETSKDDRSTLYIDDYGWKDDLIYIAHYEKKTISTSIDDSFLLLEQSQTAQIEFTYLSL